LPIQSACRFGPAGAFNGAVCRGNPVKKKSRPPLILLLILHNFYRETEKPNHRCPESTLIRRNSETKPKAVVNDADISARADRVADIVRHNPA
jgi:hypothetical protein